MANPRRILRLQSLMLEIAAETLQREGRDPRLDLVTLTRVKLAPDLGHAILYWSCLSKEEGRQKTEAALQGILPLLQRQVGHGLGIRVTPILTLRFDPTLENAQRLDDIFHRLAEERGETSEDDETDDAEADEEAPGPARG